jgi:hypothetical protein
MRIHELNVSPADAPPREERALHTEPA